MQDSILWMNGTAYAGLCWFQLCDRRFLSCRVQNTAVCHSGSLNRRATFDLQTNHHELIGLDGGFVRFAGTYSYDLFDIGDKNLAIADFSGACATDNGLNNAVNLFREHYNFDLYLG